MGVSALPIVGVALSAASAAVFFLVARAVWKRPVSTESKLARDAFVTWWVVLGFVTMVGLALQSPSFPNSVPAFLAITVASLALLCIGLWGLLYYLLFLFTSRRNLALPLALGYIVYFAFLTAFILAGDPMSVESTKWGPKLEYGHPIESGPVYWAAILLLILPPFLAAGGYLSLYWKVDQPVQKRRILLVSVSILVWFGSSLLTSGAGAGEADWWQVASRVIGLSAALTIYYAYRYLRPPEAKAANTPTKPSGDKPLYESPGNRLARVTRLAA